MSQHEYIESTCNQANDKFKIVSKSEMKKFIFTPQWLRFHANQFEKEINNIRPQGYYFYNRGSVVMIDFGINVSSEFSGKHFAIVLNKKDNNKNPVLTVIPLTSKYRKGRLNLGDQIFNQSIESFNRTELNLQNERDSIVSMLSDLNETKDKLVSEYQFANSEIKKLRDKHAEDEQYVLNEDEEQYFIPLVKRLEALANDLDEKVEILDKKSDAFEEDLKLLNEVRAAYTKYNNSSYARTTDIKTISKKRIRSINKFDPSGKIILPEQVMEAISRDLIRNFASEIG